MVKEDVQTELGIIPRVTGASHAATEISKVYKALREGETTVKEANRTMQNYTGTIYSQRRAIMMIRTSYRNQHAALLESMRGLMAVARLGRTMIHTFTTFTLMQTRVADSTRDVRDSEENLNRVREYRIQVQRDLGESNVHALGLLSQEERLSKRLTAEKRDLKRAQDQNIIGYAGITLQALTVIPVLQDVYYHVRNTKIMMGATWSYAGLKGIVGAAAGAELAILGVSTTLGTLVTTLGIPLVLFLGVEWLTSYQEVLDWLEHIEYLMYDWWVDVGKNLREMWDDFLGTLEDPFGGGGGFGGGGAGARGDESTSSDPLQDESGSLWDNPDPFGPGGGFGGSGLTPESGGGGGGGGENYNLASAPIIIHQTNIIQDKDQEQQANIIVDRMLSDIARR